MGAERLTHVDGRGAARMVNVTQKAATHRVAVAEAVVRMRRETLAIIMDGRAAKGDALGVARVAGIMAAKKTSELIPLCHPLALTHVSVDFEPAADGVLVRSAAETSGPTGVEMEALTAAAVAALTIYDMCKAVDRGMTIDGLGLLLKDGGKSGRWSREGEQ